MKKPPKDQTTTLPDIMFTSTASSLPTRVYIHTGTSMVTTNPKVSNDSSKTGEAHTGKTDQNVGEENATETKANDGIPNVEDSNVKNHQKMDHTDNEVKVKDVQKDKSKVHGNSTKSRDKKQLSDNKAMGNDRTPEMQPSPDVKESLKLPELRHNSRSPSLAGTPNVSPRKSTQSSSPRLSGDKSINAGKDLYTQVLQNARKSRAQDKSHNFPDVKIKYLDKRENTKDLLKNQEMIPIPFSHTDRKVTVVRNAMYGNFLRKSTKKLQDDLRQTMRVYSSEKHELLRQLASLRHEMDELKATDSSSSPTSFSSDSSSVKSTPRFFKAPNLAANKVRKKGRRRNNSVTSDETMGSQNQKIKEGILRLPTIKDASPAPQEWESGNSMHTNLPPIEHPKGLVAVKALMDNNFSIPKISDPSREDISVSSLRQQSNREKKKVHFSEENKITEFEVIRYNDNEAKNWRRGGENSPNDYYRKPRASKKGKGERGGSRLTLAPLKRPNDPKEAQKVAAEYKSLYLSIHDPEERTKTLADILYAVRMRMQENEQNLKFGESPRPSKTNNTLCDFLLSNSSEDPLLKGEPNKVGNKFLGAPNHTAARIGRRSNAIQLQNYLRKMSKSRRMIEHMEAEQYRLAHIMGHKHLMAASQAAQA